MREGGRRRERGNGGLDEAKQMTPRAAVVTLCALPLLGHPEWLIRGLGGNKNCLRRGFERKQRI